MKNDKQRLFEVMGRLDKTFKPRLNEGFEELEPTDDVEVSAEVSPEEVPAEEPVEEKSPEEKLQELTAKVDELYALLHGETGEEVPVGEPEEIGVETGEVDLENLQEWNFDKKKGEDKEEKEEDKEHEDSESSKEEKEEIDEKIDAPAKPKVPVAAVAKVGK